MTLSPHRALLFAVLLLALGAAAALGWTHWRNAGAGGLPPSRAAAPAAAAPVGDDPAANAVAQRLAERIPMLPPIDEVQRSPVPGWWQVRFGGSEILYADEAGEHIFVSGMLVETSTRTDLTDAALAQALAVPWDKLPLDDALVFRQGAGTRQMVVFADPNCGYCKRFERDIARIQDVTIYTFLIPILGPDSETKSRDIWCAADAGSAWRGWMLNGALPQTAPADCDAQAVERNRAFARSHMITGTPTVFFPDGTRKPGAIPLQEVEQLLAAAAQKK